MTRGPTWLRVTIEMVIVALAFTAGVVAADAPRWAAESGLLMFSSGTTTLEVSTTNPLPVTLP